MKNIIALFISLFIGTIVSVLYGQEVAQDTELLQCVERYYGSNNLLLNGRPYIAVNTKASGHPYFFDEEFSPGKLFIKGQQFENVALKLNIEKDQLILQENMTNGIPVQLIITPALVDSFFIQQHFFVNNRVVSRDIDKVGFMQQLYAGGLNFYKQQTKLYQPKFSQLHPFGQYITDENKYFLVSEKGVQELKNKKDFLTFFGDKKKTVKRYMKQQSIKFKKASDAQFYNLLNYCDELY